MRQTIRMIIALLMTLSFCVGCTESKKKENPKSESEETQSEAADDETVTGDADPWIDEEYPELTATFDGEPMKIRAAIAFVQEVTNATGTPEGARRVHLFTQPTNCKRGKKAFINKANKAEYVRFQFQTGQAVVLSANSPGNQLRGLNTTGFDGIDFSKVDTTPGALSTITIEGKGTPMEGMENAAGWSVSGTVTVKGCGER